MDSLVTTLLEELYRIDPTLRNHEAELIPLVEKLLRHKPDIRPDERFVQELRAQLTERASLSSATKDGRGSLFPFLTMHTLSRLTPAIAGLLVGVLLAVPATYLVLRPESLPSFVRGDADGTDSLFTYSVRPEATNRAFGALDAVATVPQGRGGGGGGGGDVAAESAALDAPATSKIYPPEYQEYVFLYEGGFPELPATVNVLQREKAIAAPAASSVLKNFNIGMVDLGSFTDARVDAVNFSQQQEFGYMFYVSLREGTISISQDWERWPHPESRCTSEECYQQYRPTPADVPTDGKAVEIAQGFLQSHGIDIAQYGAPEVDNNWRREYERMEDKRYAYVPDSVRVIFPLLVEGEPVYDMGGGKSGISVGVHVKHLRVSDVWGIQNQTYASSAYDGIQDAEVIRTYLKNLEKMPVSVLDQNDGATVKTVEIKLGEPKTGYTLTYLQDGTQSKELLVPALIFPVLDVPEGQYYYRQYITVPLAAELLGKQDGRLYMQ